MNHSLNRRVDALADQIGAGCPHCRELSPLVVIVRGTAEPSAPPQCPACGRERAVTVIEIHRVDRDDRRPA